MRQRPVATALLMARTVRQLRAAQVAHRVRLRAKGAAFARFPGPLGRSLRAVPPPAACGWPPRFVPLDGQEAAARNGERSEADAEAFASGRFTFLADERSMHTATGGWDWDQSGASRLWRFHLHGFEWAWAFAAHPDRRRASAAFAEVWRSWEASTTVGLGDAWSPFVASLRAWALCGLHEPLLTGTGGGDDAGNVAGRVAASLAVHARFLRTHLELDVGGNHLVKNLKALAGLGVFLGDDHVADFAGTRLAAEVPRQVLADGGHYERSPSYHCQVLGDLIDVSGLLSAAGRPPVAAVDGAITAMRAWLATVLLPNGTVPLFNDGAPVSRDRIALLAPAVSGRPPRPIEVAGPARLTLLSPSGYVTAKAGRLDMIADVGLPCPPELPAHAHADCLSFQLAVDGRLVVGATGTSTYVAGPRRDYERSTAAHSTVEVDGQDQTEVWGAFRAARRAQPRIDRAGVDASGTAVVTAWHDGYERLSGRPRHRRTWRVTSGGVEVVDEITGAGVHRSVARLVLAPGTAVTHLEGGRFTAGPLEVLLTGGSAREQTVDVAPGFGRLVPARCLALEAVGPLPHRLVTMLTVV